MKTSSRGLTPNEILGNLFIFFFAGYETTATTVAANLLYMLRNPQYIEKVRGEAARIAVKDTSDLTAESIPWTTAIVYETLRLVPPVGLHLRTARNPVEIEGTVGKKYLDSPCSTTPCG